MERGKEKEEGHVDAFGRRKTKLPPPNLLQASVINMAIVNDRNGFPERHQAFPTCYPTELQSLLQEVSLLCHFTDIKGTIPDFPAVSATWLLQRPLIQGLLEESPGCHTM